MVRGGFQKNGLTLLATVAAGVVTYHHPDHLSNRLETNSAGTVTRSFGQLPFGDTWHETGTADKWKFTTYERDPESGLDYATERYYSNGYGRFTTADLLPGHLGDPQSLNRYSYVTSDPINMVDPLGLHLFLVTSYSLCTSSTDENGRVTDVDCTLLSQSVTDLEPGSDGGGGGGGVGKPGLPAHARDRARILLSNADCAKFLNSLLANLGETQDLNEFLSNFDHLTIIPTPDPANDSYLTQHPGRYPTAHVDAINPLAATRTQANTTVHVDEPDAADLSQTLLHEELHTFPYSFSDQQLAKAAGLGDFPNNTAGADDASRSFSQEMSKHCHD